MSAKDVQAVAHVAEGARVVRAGRVTMECLRVAVSRSIVAVALRHVRAELNGADAAERIRLAGVFILTAAATHAALLQWTPPLVRPAAQRLLQAEILVVGLVLIVMARTVARAWDGSQLRRVLIRIRESSRSYSSRLS